MLLKDEVAIITGAARGIGRSIAEKFASQGSHLAIIDVNLEAAEQTAQELAKQYGVKTMAARTDVSNAEDVDAMVKKVLDTFGRIDILVNNAGVTRDNLMLRMKDEEWDLVININLKGVFVCTRSVARHMAKARKGNIINIASVVGQMGNAGQANYTASKGGVIALTKTTAREFAGRNVRVNAVAPGFINTAMTEVLSEQVKTEMLRQVPLDRMGEPEDIANGCLFLASGMSAYITGHVLAINGGMLMQ
ncbi:MAG TPA: 3-oxoacyl-[acyl-carrier-protein] reductase [Spirochaetota bacterium]|nr:3-oxoacyl-[acyl-carrier-protein] reductase [Spirochaetota bacterium]